MHVRACVIACGLHALELSACTAHCFGGTCTRLRALAFLLYFVELFFGLQIQIQKAKF